MSERTERRDRIMGTRVQREKLSAATQAAAPSLRVISCPTIQQLKLAFLRRKWGSR